MDRATPSPVFTQDTSSNFRSTTAIKRKMFAIGNDEFQQSKSVDEQEEQAKRDAMELVRSLLSSPDQLSRVTVYKQQLERRKQQVNLLLSSAVRSQVEETRLGLELITRSDSSLQRIRSQAVEIDKVCSDVQRLVPSYDLVQKVNLARGNLDMAERMLRSVRAMSERTLALQELLEEHDSAIHVVYKEYRRLVRVRTKAEQQARSIGDERVLMSLHGRFDVVAELGQLLADTVWGNIEDALLLSEEDPATLVRTLEVIEMEERSQRKVLVMTTSTSRSGKGADTTQVAVREGALRERVLWVLANAVALTFRELAMSEEDRRREQEAKLAAIAQRKEEEEARQERAREELAVEMERQKELARAERERKNLERQQRVEMKQREKERKAEEKRRRAAVKKAMVAKTKQQQALQRRQRRGLDSFTDSDSDSASDSDGDVRFVSDSEDDEDDDLSDSMGGFGKGAKAKKSGFGNSRRKGADSDDDDLSSLSDSDSDGHGYGMGMGRGRGAGAGKATAAKGKGKSASRFGSDSDGVSESASESATDSDSDSGGGWGQRQPAATAGKGGAKGKARGVAVSDSDSDSEDLDAAVGRIGFGNTGAGSGKGKGKTDGGGDGARFESSEEDSGSEYTDVEEEYQVEVTDEDSDAHNAAFDSDSDSMPEELDFDMGDLADSGLSKGKGKGKSPAAGKAGAAKTPAKAKKTKLVTRKRTVRVKKEKGSFGKGGQKGKGKGKGAAAAAQPVVPAQPSWKEVMMEQEGAKEQEDPIVGVVGSLRQYLADLRVVKDKMAPCFPPHYKVVQHMVREYMRWARMVLNVRMQERELGKKGLLAVVKLVSDISESRDVQLLAAHDQEHLLRLLMETMEKYVALALGTLQTIAANILTAMEAAKVQEDDGHKWYTVGNVDVFDVLHQQADVSVRAGVRGAAMYYVADMCVSLLNEYAQRLESMCRQFYVEPVPERKEEEEGKRDDDDGLVMARADKTQDKNAETPVGPYRFLFGPKLVLRNEIYVAALANDAAVGEHAVLGLGKHFCAIICPQHYDEDGPKRAAKGAGQEEGDSDGEAETEQARSRVRLDDDVGRDAVTVPHISDPALATAEQLAGAIYARVRNTALSFTSIATASIDGYVIMALHRAQPAFKNLFSPAWYRGDTLKPVIGCLAEALDNADVWLARDGDFAETCHALVCAFVYKYVLTLAEKPPALNTAELATRDARITRVGDDRLEVLSAVIAYKDAGVSEQVLLGELGKLSLVQDVLETSVDCLSVFFGKLHQAFPIRAAQIVSGLLNMSPELSKAQKKEVLEELSAAGGGDIYLLTPSTYEHTAHVHALVERKPEAPPKDGGAGKAAATAKKGLWSFWRKDDKGGPAPTPAQTEKEKAAVKKANAKEETLGIDDFFDD